jgi:hypothetical protein
MTKKRIIRDNVADPGCLSRIPVQNFFPSRILDLQHWLKGGKGEEEEKKMVLSSSMLHKIISKVGWVSSVADLGCISRIRISPLGYSDFHNLMGFTSKKMPNNILKNVC